MSAASTPPDLFAQFCEAFPGLGEAEVKAAIKDHWDAEKTFTPLPDLYNALMDESVKKESAAGRADRHISAPVADVLTRLFAESFRPEQTTGYAPKHRAPLINALAQHYADTYRTHEDPSDPTAPIYRVKIDIANLGGLNRELEKLDKENGRRLADQVLGIITGVLANNLAEHGTIVPIRSGGDEMEILITPKADGQPAKDKKAAIEDELTEVQETISQFIHAAGMDSIIHLKNANNPYKAGVNFGFSIVPIRHDKLWETRLAEAEIATSKLLWEMTQREENIPIVAVAPDDPRSIVERERLDEALEKYRSNKYNCDTPLTTPHPIPNAITTEALKEKPPELARRKKYELLAEQAKGAALNPDEIRAISALHALTKRVDHVTGLPMFSDMQTDLLPHILAHGAKKSGARLVHFDFSNMAGGNLIGEWVGDAMGKAYTRMLQTALRLYDLSAYTPYLTSQGGGKFALLVPMDITKPGHRHYMTSIRRNISSDLGGEDPNAIDIHRFLSEEERQQAFARVQQIEEYYAKPQIAAIENTGALRLRDIINPKTKKAGTKFSMAWSDHAINADQSVYEAIEPLENDAQAQQEAVSPPTADELRSYIFRYLKYRFNQNDNLRPHYNSIEMAPTPSMKARKPTYYVRLSSTDNKSKISHAARETMRQLMMDMSLAYVNASDTPIITTLPVTQNKLLSVIRLINSDQAFVASVGAEKLDVGPDSSWVQSSQSSPGKPPAKRPDSRPSGRWIG